MTHQPDAGDDVFVVDTLGELACFYACADVAFVGGSLEDIGGHNLLEPAAAGTAMVTGPHLRNFADIAAQLEAAGALRIGADEAAVGDALEMLLADADARASMAHSAQQLLESGRGALQRTLGFVEAMAPAATAG
jgi:3-deoxy-D-manno-octulosonic-acid transferase